MLDHDIQCGILLRIENIEKKFNLLVSIGWKIGLEEMNAWSWYLMWYTVRTERKKRNLMNLLVSRGWKMDLRRWLLDHEIQCGILLRIENIEKKFNEFASLQRMENGLEEMNAWSHDSQQSTDFGQFSKLCYRNNAEREKDIIVIFKLLW